MTHRIAVIGNSSINLGVASAGDLALAGHEVNFFVWPEDAAFLDIIKAQNGIEVRGDVRELVSGKTGRASLRTATTDIAEAVEGAELIIVDVPWPALEQRFEQLLPVLTNGQVVHVNMHGYWSSFRVAEMLREADKEGVILTEGPDPTISAGYADGTVTPHRLKRNLPVAAFPAKRNAEALSLLTRIYPNVVSAENVLQTNFESMNFMIHPAMSLLSITAFDWAGEAGEPIRFYRDGNTRHAGVLSKALDAERGRVCRAYGVRFKPFHEQVNELYGASGRNFQEAVAGSKWLQNLPPLPNDVWQTWMRADAPLLHVPFVSLAEHAGEQVPMYRSLVDLLGGILECDFWATGLTLERFGIKDLSPSQIVEYASEGRRSR